MSGARQRRQLLSAISVALAGAGMLAFAALVDAAQIETALRGAARGELKWGPDLFRGLSAFHGLALLLLAALLTRCSGQPQRAATSARGSATVSGVESTSALPPATTDVRGAWWIVALLMLLGTALRVYELNSCLWFDELLTLVDFVQHPWGLAVSEFPNQNQHMFYTVLAKLCFEIAGESFAALRAPSVLFGVLSIPALYLLGRRTVGSRDALLACALLTLSYHHVWFSQNARGYMMLLCLTIANTWLFLAALQRGRALLWSGYGLTAALGIWSHMTMVFVLFAQGLVWCQQIVLAASRPAAAGRLDRAFWWKCLLAWLFGATLTIQLHAVALPEFFERALHEESKQTQWTNPFWVVTESLNAFLQKGPAGIVLLAGGLATLGVGVIGVARRDWRAAQVMILPGVIGGAAMIATGHNLWPRFFFFCMGYALLFAIHGAVALPRWALAAIAPRSAAQRWPTTVGIVLALLLIAASAATLPRNYRHPRQDFSGARDFIERERRTEDGVIGVGLAGVAYDRYFAPPDRYPNWTVAQDGDALRAARARFERSWLVYTIPTEVIGYRPGVWEQIQSDFENVRSFPGTLGDGAVHVCREKPAADRGAPGDPRGQPPLR